ncbi:MAG TPA: hypothetical protein VFU69_10255 [Ktedonobacterales bacterium]|nr:hypothetical protein [Ktedonobacterales bacterium]
MPNTNLPLVLVDFTYTPPDGWSEVQKSQTFDELSVMMCPPGGNWLSRFFLRFRFYGLLSMLELHVYQYMEERVTDYSRFRDIILHNLSERGATNIESQTGIRHGETSYEATFRMFASYSSLVSFVFKGNMFLIIWSSTDKITFLGYLPKMERFIEGLQFRTEKEAS